MTVHRFMSDSEYDCLIKNKSIDFQTFWNAYALKRDRIAAERAWNRLSIKDKQAAFAGIETYREDCERRGIHRMYAQGYISHRRWEDEQETPISVSPVSTADKPDTQVFEKIEKWK